MQGIELEIVEEAEQSGFVDESNIDWNNLSAFCLFQKLLFYLQAIWCLRRWSLPPW